MSKIKYGSQTYPWQMNIEKFRGQVPHMLDILVQAGFTGIEAEICMLDTYYKDWQRLKNLLVIMFLQYILQMLTHILHN